MELIHADSLLSEIRQITSFEQWDVVSSLSDKDNDFQLNLDDQGWKLKPIEIGHYLYEKGTEFGGRVLGLKHVGNQIQVKGRTWRGLLIDKIVKPPGGSAYKTITSVEANTAIGDLISTMGPLFTASTADSGIIVSGAFRYETLLYSLHRLLADSNARLKLEFDGTVVTLSAVAIADLSVDEEFSQDVSDKIEAARDQSLAYNHVVALGSGELTARTVVDLYRDENGAISTTPNPPWIEDRQKVLGFPNAESTDILTAKATELLSKDYLPTESVDIDLPDDVGLSLGDIVGGRDYIMGLSIARQITQIIRTVKKDGVSVQYKVGE